MAPEYEFIQFVKGIKTKNPKRLKAKVAMEAHRFHDRVKRGMLSILLESADPVKYIDRCIKEVDEIGLVIKQFQEEGCHGIIRHGDDIYPVKLDTRANWLSEGVEWDLEQEKEIMYEAVETWKAETGKKSVVVLITLFSNFGFSGIPRAIAR